MSETQNKQIFKEAESQLVDKEKELLINEVKSIITKNREKKEELKEQKADIEEKIRVIDMELEDLRNGRFEQIKERIEKYLKAREVSPLQPFQIVQIIEREKQYFPKVNWTLNNQVWWNNTSGTYLLNNGTTFYF